MKTRQELIEEQQRLQVLYPEVVKELMSIPGVEKVGIGVKEVGEELTGEIVFRVYVKEKKPLHELPPDRIIPPEVRGIKTDVVIAREAYDEEDSEEYRPVKAGVQIGADGSGGVGTLGCFARLTSDDSIVILSNHHVLYDSGATDNTEIGQPQHSRFCCCTCNDIAINVHGIRGAQGTPKAHLDCAIAKLKPDIKYDARVREIGHITGVANAVSGENVKKRGRTTGLTTGVITNIDFDATGTRILEIEVKKNNGNDRFSRPGDSGSALLNGADEIIGLHKEGRNRENIPPGQFYSKSTGIQEVLDALQNDGFLISIITGIEGDESTSVAQLALVTKNMERSFQIIEQRLRSSETGQKLWQMIERHRQEALHLVNHVRAVTVTWHRKEGPAFLAAITRSVKEPAYKIPVEINGISRQHALTSIIAVLEAHASEQFQADIGKYSLLLTRIYSQYDTVEEFIEVWEEATSLAEEKELVCS